MQRLPREKKLRAILLMDKDRVGLAIAFLVAAVVLAVSLLLAGVEGFEVIFRVGVAFTVTYVVTFVSFGFIQRTAGGELSAQEERRLAEEAAARRRVEEEESGTGSPGEDE
ncbi:MAG: hypothetical protein IT364_23555 [Candidatus Hydrogenedentes bacterium]|nr:hypothetical protein [Candidatus Hydrogenedentota bacterium]